MQKKNSIRKFSLSFGTNSHPRGELKCAEVPPFLGPVVPRELSIKNCICMLGSIQYGVRLKMCANHAKI